MDFNNVICDRLRQENIELIKANAELTNRVRLLQGVNEAILEELLKMRQANKGLVQQLNNLREESDDLKYYFNRAREQTEDDTVVVLDTILKDYFTHLY